MRRLRFQSLTQTRRFSSLPPLRAPRNPSRFDSTGRTPGFARKHPARIPAGQPQNQPKPPQDSSAQTPPSPEKKNEAISNALQDGAENNSLSLLSPVHIPEDSNAILKSNHPSTSILANSSIVVQRQLEMMNVFLGFEQANKYIVMDPAGSHIGFIAEQDHGVGNMFARQMFRTHRSFTTHVFDRDEKEVLRFHRPFSWISSRITAYDATSADMSRYETSSALQGTSLGSVANQTSAQVSPLALRDMRVIGEAQQQWAPLRRKYNLFLHRELSRQQSDPDAPRLTSGNLPLSASKALTVTNNEGDSRQMGFAQFAYVNEPFLSWDFSLLSADDKLVGSVNRNFAGWGRELFTDTGVYALRMDAAGLEPTQSSDQSAAPSLGMTLDQRAVMLATAVSIDFDYFSRHSGVGHGGGFMPMWFPIGMGGGGAAAGEAGAGAGAGAAGAGAAEAGAIETGASGAVTGAGNAARGLGAGEGAVTGAATMAGYEAMQRGRERSTEGQEQSPQAPPDNMADGEVYDPWGQSRGPDGQSGGGGGGGGGSGDGGGGDGGGFNIDDFF